jgi:hypothetical protein
MPTKSPSENNNKYIIKNNLVATRSSLTKKQFSFQMKK